MTLVRHFCCIQTSLIVFLLATTVRAGEWDIVPRLTVVETYTDNVDLDESNKNSEFITEVNPGISVQGKSREASQRYERQRVPEHDAILSCK